MANEAYLLKDNRSKIVVRDWLADSMEWYGRHSAKTWSDKDALCESLLGSIAGQVDTPSGRIYADRYKLRGRGPRAEESSSGADGLGSVGIRTHGTALDGLFLFRAKECEHLTIPLRDARERCGKMPTHTAASQLLVLTPGYVNMVGAVAASARSSQ